MHTIYKAGTCALIAGILLLAPCFPALSDADPPDIESSAVRTPATDSADMLMLAESSVPAEVDAAIEATFTQNGTTGTWQAHVSGSYGPGVAIQELYLYGEDAAGNIAETHALGYGTAIKNLPPDFRFSSKVSKLDLDWAYMGIRMQVTGPDGLWHNIYSEPFPIIWEQPVLIDHLDGGSVVEPSNYVPDGIPEGVGIPYSFLRSLESGTYYAVVFFDGVDGCPSDNYEFNAFIPGQVWGEDHVGSGYMKAHGTEGGGCMERFVIDPKERGDGWMWGALSPTGSAPAVADSSGTPAFAICGSEDACDRLTVRADAPEPPAHGEATSTDPNLVSSVLFLPGMKGSRLYEENPLCLIPSDSCDIPMWLPLADAATPGLYMSAAGTSRRNLYTHEGDLLSEAFGHEFYSSFTDMLDRAQEDGSFGDGWEWKPIAYDWRRSLPDLVRKGARHGTRIYYGEASSTPYIEESLRALASSSPTGKVTIVAHSNGGLVAKALMQELGAEETSRLVDSVILAGVPQSGAPRALGALLFGDGEGIPGIANFPDFIMSAAHAREFARGAPVAYHLLPSATYMAAKNPSYPLVTFEDSPLLATARARYGDTIDTAAELRDYAMGKGGRPLPDVEDLTLPAILTGNLLDYAADEHGMLDTWEPPEGVEVYEIGGHSAPTISGIDLYEAPTEEGTPHLAYRPLFSYDGDGTVPVISALMMDSGGPVHALWADLESMRSSESAYGHANLLEAPSIQEEVKNILHGTADLPPHISAAAPQGDGGRAFLAFFLHSPVSLSVADSQGNRTEVNGDVILHEDIPGSTAGSLGDVSYVLVPADAPYALSLDGQAAGTFTLDLQELEDGDVTASSTFAEMPVTESTVATLTVEGHIASTSPLALDEDGDGTDESYIGPKLGAVSFPSDRVEPPAAPADEESSSSGTSSRTHAHHSGSHGSSDDEAERAPLPPQGFSTSTHVGVEMSLRENAEAHPIEQRVSEPASAAPVAAARSSAYQELSALAHSTDVPEEHERQDAPVEDSREPHASLMQRFLRFLVKIALVLRHLVSPLIP